MKYFGAWEKMLNCVRLHSENVPLVLRRNSKRGYPFLLQVTQYLLDKALIIDEDTLYELSLKIEPRLPAWPSTLPRVRGIFMESRADRTVHATPPAALRGQGLGDKASLLCAPEMTEPNQNSVSSQGSPAGWDQGQMLQTWVGSWREWCLVKLRACLHEGV